MKNLLVIRFSALGDVAMTIPSIVALAKEYPELQITFLSRKQYGNLFKNLPENIHFFGADSRKEHKGIRGLNTLLRQINYRQFDAVADLHNVLRSLYLDLRFLLAGKRVKVLDKARFAKWRLTRRTFKHLHQLPTVFDRQQAVFKRLGLHIERPVILSHDKTQKEGIGIAPFAAHKGKVYPVESMRKVVELVRQQTAEPIYLFGAGKNEHDILQSWADTIDNVFNIAGKYTLDKELEIISHLRVMLSMDSANMHLASLVGTRVVSIWGATHPYAGFLGTGQKAEDCVQLDLSCRPCSIYGNRECYRHDYRCMGMIEPEQIIRVLDKTNNFVGKEIIHRGRNTLARGMYADRYAVCKQYAQPAFLQSFIYRYIRAPKAECAYFNALHLRSLGIETPEPLTFSVERRTLGIGESYFLSAWCPYQHTAYEWGDATPDKYEAVVKAFAHWAAEMHEKGVLHKDFSPGNILWTEEDGEYRFCLVDINRLRFRHVSVDKGLSNMCRLWGQQPLLKLLAETYAEARNADKDVCWQKLHCAHKSYWTRRRRRKHLGDCITHHNIDGTSLSYHFDFI